VPALKSVFKTLFWLFWAFRSRGADLNSTSRRSGDRRREPTIHGDLLKIYRRANELVSSLYILLRRRSTCF